MTQQFYQDSIFWIDVDKIDPNPFQPRREFDQAQMQSLSDSIRQYGVLQALVVTRKEVPKDDGLSVRYELIAGERRLRASKMAGLLQVPCLIKVGEETDLMKLELAIIENLQREDLNAVDRARAFKRLVDEFHFKHETVAMKVGKSRVYVTNTLRLLTLPDEILEALSSGQISEGHTRPLMSLNDRPEEQKTLFKEIVFKRMTVREAEAAGRRVAYDKIRNKSYIIEPEILELEERLAESLGTRVSIEKKENGGKITIDFFSQEDLKNIIDHIKSDQKKSPTDMLDRYIAQNPEMPKNDFITNNIRAPEIATLSVEDLDDRTVEEKKNDENSEEDIYSVKNFSI